MNYIAKRTGMLILTILLISIVTFFAFSVLPGDASVSKLGTEATPERIEQLRKEMGLNEPIPIRYVKWLRDACCLDFGQSFQYTGVSVRSLIGERLGVTALLAGLSFLMILLISYPLGIFCGKHKSGNIMDFLIRIMMAVPPFFLGILITFLLGITLRLFTPGNFVFPTEDFFGCLWYLLFPALAIALPKSAMTIRFLSEAVRGESKKDYVRTAYSKGCSSNQVFYRHILKNAMIPVVTFLALVFVDIIAGSLIVEQVFSVAGIGRLLVTAIFNRDFPVVQGIVLLLTGITVIINTLVDLAYHLIDPRTRSTPQN